MGIVFAMPILQKVDFNVIMNKGSLGGGDCLSVKTKIDNICEKIVLGFHIYSDIFLGVFLMLFSVYMFMESFSIKIVKEPVSPLDTASFFPRLVFGVLFIIGVSMTGMGRSKLEANKSSVPTGEELSASVLALKRSVITFAFIFSFILLMVQLGFIPTAIIYMVTSMFFMASKEIWKPKAYIITAVIVALACYFLFREFLYVRLPAGILEGVL